MHFAISVSSTVVGCHGEPRRCRKLSFVVDTDPVLPVETTTRIPAIQTSGAPLSMTNLSRFADIPLGSHRNLQRWFKLVLLIRQRYR